MANGSGGRIAGDTLKGAGSGAAIGTAIAPGLGTAIGAGAGALLGGIMSAISEAESAGDIARARQYREQALKLIEQLNVPDEVKLQAQLLGPSAMGGVQQDGRSLAAIQQLLSQIQDQASGNDPIQQQAYQAAFRGADRQAYNQMQDALAQSARRGVRGSGAELSSLLKANEGGADAVAQAQMAAASDMYRRRFSALQTALSGNQQERDVALGLSSNKANAADRISQFNASQAWNQQLAQAQQTQMAYQNRAQQAQMRAGAMNQRSQYSLDDAQNTRDGYQAAMQGLAQGSAAFAPYAKQAFGSGAAGTVASQAMPMDRSIETGWDVPAPTESYAQLLAKKKALMGG